MHIQINTIVPALKGFGLVKGETARFQSVLYIHVKALWWEKGEVAMQGCRCTEVGFLWLHCEHINDQTRSHFMAKNAHDKLRDLLFVFTINGIKWNLEFSNWQVVCVGWASDMPPSMTYVIVSVVIRLEIVNLIWQPSVSHHASSSRCSALRSLSRCLWMARQTRQRMPPLREETVIQDGLT